MVALVATVVAVLLLPHPVAADQQAELDRTRRQLGEVLQRLTAPEAQEVLSTLPYLAGHEGWAAATVRAPASRIVAAGPLNATRSRSSG